ncbi:hypothetical protein ACFSZS_13755 [Seohaeicola zhoushanensis]
MGYFGEISAAFAVMARKLREIGRKLWVRVIGIAALSLVAAIGAKLFAHLIPKASARRSVPTRWWGSSRSSPMRCWRSRPSRSA